MEDTNINEYDVFVGGIVRQYWQGQIKVATAVNVTMLKFYWLLGADIVRMKKNQLRGDGFMFRISRNLQKLMPNAKYFRPRIFMFAVSLSYIVRWQ